MFANFYDADSSFQGEVTEGGVGKKCEPQALLNL